MSQPQAASAANHPRGRIPELDGIRGLAVILVVVYHGYQIAGFPWNDSLLSRIIGTGWMGVDLFFVLSGFLITGILLKTKDHPRYWSRFAIRRALRILPLYACFSLLCVLTALTMPGHEKVPWWVFFTMLQNWWIGANADATVLTTVVTWSLAVEEQFYLLWPLAVYLLSRRQLKGLLVVLVLAAPIWRLLALHHAGPFAAYMWTPGRLDTMAFGALLAVWCYEERTALLNGFSLLAIPLFLGLVAGVVFGVFDQGQVAFVVVGYSFLALTAASWLIAVWLGSFELVTKCFRSAPLVYVGKTSYGIYLLHAPCYQFARKTLEATIGIPADGWVSLILYIALGTGLTLAAASVSWKYLESPFLALKHRLAP